MTELWCLPAVRQAQQAPCRAHASLAPVSSWPHNHSIVDPLQQADNGVPPQTLSAWTAIPPVRYTPHPASHLQSPAELRARSRWQQRPGHDVVHHPQAGRRPWRSEAQHLHCQAMASLQACISTPSRPATLGQDPLDQATGRWLLLQQACASGGDLCGMSMPQCTRLWAGYTATTGTGSPVPGQRQRSTRGHARHEERLQARFELSLEASRVPGGVDAAGAGSQLPPWLQRIGKVGHHLHQ